MSFLSALIVFLGIIHFLDTFPLPNKGAGYSIVLISFAILVIISSFLNNLLIGIEKFFLVIQGLAILGIATLPLLPNILTFMPREGPIYAGMIIIVGAIGIVYGFMGVG